MSQGVPYRGRRVDEGIAMGWSTREVADLAGTSLRAVRHYHDVGLLPEPERRWNGYKQYGVAHLVRLLRIKRLVDLGFSLPQIADLGDRDEHPEEALRALDADLLAQIDRLQRLRAELAELLESGGPTDLPAEFATRTASLSDADRGMVSLMGRLLGEEGRATYAGLLTDDARTPADDEFDALAPDVDEATRQDLAVRLLAGLEQVAERHPGLWTVGTDTPVGPQRYRAALGHAFAELYNPAQLDVMRRLQVLRAAKDV